MSVERADVRARFRYRKLNNDDFMTYEESPLLDEKVFDGHGGVDVPETISEEGYDGPRNEKGF